MNHLCASICTIQIFVDWKTTSLLYCCLNFIMGFSIDENKLCPYLSLSIAFICTSLYMRLIFQFSYKTYHPIKTNSTTCNLITSKLNLELHNARINIWSQLWTIVQRCVKYRHFTQFPGMEILQKGSIFKKLSEILIFYAVLRCNNVATQVQLAMSMTNRRNSFRV